MTRHDSDRAAVRRCLGGDSGAFAELLERYQNQIFSLVLRMVRNPADAEDLAQDAFVKAFRNLASYDPEQPFITWLFKIAHNTTIDFLRRKRPETVSIPEDDSLVDRGLSAADAVVGEAVAERLLGSLTPLYREALLLRHKEGLALKEIAGLLGIPEGTVKIRLFRARELLKDKVGAEAA